ncbi:hypothetical protein EOS_02550 [Caballeronia mineralivorans PML1(12)]|uniref:Glycosyl transferase family 1 n=1 Tax=Caballeronia mineralivorans PML1(12) TaxID=908627 RepID=A0A0J1D4X0_9BURK|nr:glycosyltransferase family 1 protein [Caballeronia mineralivorans]KLU27757.1 hypothetical protein EOS_02550 [Caballeronia mineralivorans PML1(12)]
MRIVLDLQGCQSVSRLRGIGRYSFALAKAIIRNAGEHEIWIVLNDLFPETIDLIRAAFEEVIPVERIATFSLPSFSLYQGARDWRTRAAEIIREYAIAELEPDLVHISSLFEGYVDVSVSSVKAYDKVTLTAVTLYDLIPFLNPEKYLTDLGFKKHYFGKIEALKRVDVVLTISAYCGEEAVRELGIPTERITNISSAVAESFACSTISEEDILSLWARFGISRPFVMTTGTVEPRKNLEGLIVAYSKLPSELRKKYQLLLVCQATEANRIKLFDLAVKHGLASDDLVLAGYVSDKDLIGLYTACHLFVFPSLHEGFGLPALEAMACGSAVIASGATSIPEVIGRDDALFNPLDLQQMADMIERALSDGDYRQSLKDHAAVQVRKFSWDATGKRALQAFEKEYEARFVESARLKRTAEARYQSLIETLTALELPVTEADFATGADAIAANQRAGRRKQILVDVSVLCENGARSGIQRVTRAIVRQLLSAPPANWEVRPVRLDRSVMLYCYANHFLHTLGMGDRSIDGDDEWVDSQQGDIFLGLDLVADCVPHAEGWFAAQRRRGVNIYFVVYDLLPVRYPNWFPEVIATDFPPWLTTIGTIADGLICISRTVADDLMTWLDTSSVERARELKISYFRLGADIESSQPSTGMPDNANIILAAMRERPTFLIVGTVEPCRGHAQAFGAFEQLWARGVDVNLVIVGKAGWGVGELPDRLREHPEDGQRFFWLQGISDEFLEKVYEASKCLLAPSHGKGFGLPLIEAAQKGLPILARDLSVFREVAGQSAYYFSGDADGDLAAAVEVWLSLQKKGSVPASTRLEWITWKQSAEQISKVMLQDAWYRRWQSK